MGEVNLTLPSDSTGADVADYNNPLQDLVAEFNGNIENINIASDAAIAGSKLADDSIAPVKLSTHFKIGSIAPTANGQASVTGIGFAPKLLYMEMVTPTSISGSVNSRCQGWSDGTSTFATASFSVEGGDISGRMYTDGKICWDPKANQATDDMITLDSLDSDGFTYTKSDHTTTVTYFYICYG